MAGALGTLCRAYFGKGHGLVTFRKEKRPLCEGGLFSWSNDCDERSTVCGMSAASLPSIERLMCEVEFWEVCVRGRYNGLFNVFPHATTSLPDS